MFSLLGMVGLFFSFTCMCNLCDMLYLLFCKMEYLISITPISSNLHHFLLQNFIVLTISKCFHPLVHGIISNLFKRLWLFYMPNTMSWSKIRSNNG